MLLPAAAGVTTEQRVDHGLNEMMEIAGALALWLDRQAAQLQGNQPMRYVYVLEHVEGKPRPATMQLLLLLVLMTRAVIATVRQLLGPAAASAAAVAAAKRAGGQKHWWRDGQEQWQWWGGWR